CDQRKRLQTARSWLSRERSSFSNPTQNSRGESDESERLRKKTHPPTVPITPLDATCRKKCCQAWRQEHLEERVLRNASCTIQPRDPSKAVPEAQCAREDLERIRRNKPCDRP